MLLMWYLRNLGLNLSQQDLQILVLPALVSPDLGLLDGSGATIVNLLPHRYGVCAKSTAGVSFDDVAARAGNEPIALGGARWFVTDDGSGVGHWVVRGLFGRLNKPDSLVLTGEDSFDYLIGATSTTDLIPESVRPGAQPNLVHV